MATSPERLRDPDGILPMLPPPTDEERAASYRAIQRRHPANRFRLMFGQPLLPEGQIENAPSPCGEGRVLGQTLSHEATAVAAGGDGGSSHTPLAESTDPLPAHIASGIEAMVCEDIAARQQVGIAKYGCTVAESGDDMLQHAYEEALDLAVYLRAEIERRKAGSLVVAQAAPTPADAGKV